MLTRTSLALLAASTTAERLVTTIRDGGISVELDIALDGTQTWTPPSTSTIDEAAYTLSGDSLTSYESGLATRTPSSVAGDKSPFSEHSVVVSPDQYLTFSPPFVNAAVGDSVVFTFLALNHTLRESTLEEPCKPLDGGFSSGFNQFNAANTSGIDMKFTINSPDPRYFYCEQDKPESHCERGMIFAINPGPTYAEFLANALRQGPFSSLLASGAATLTISTDENVSATTLSDVIVPTVVAKDPTFSLPSATLAPESTKDGTRIPLVTATQVSNANGAPFPRYLRF